MGWEKWDGAGIVLCSFEAKGAHQINLKRGDVVRIQERFRTEEETSRRGFVFSNDGVESGLFRKSKSSHSKIEKKPNEEKKTKMAQAFMAWTGGETTTGSRISKQKKTIERPPPENPRAVVAPSVLHPGLSSSSLGGTSSSKIRMSICLAPAAVSTTGCTLPSLSVTWFRGVVVANCLGETRKAKPIVGIFPTTFVILTPFDGFFLSFFFSFFFFFLISGLKEKQNKTKKEEVLLFESEHTRQTDSLIFFFFY